MTFSPDLAIRNLSLLIGPKAESETMIELAATLALRGPVRILDGGNRFDAYRLARLIRRQTPQLGETLAGVHVARAFTCYQVVTLFEQTPATAIPQLVLDLLATFYDENVSLKESYRLLHIVLEHLDRLRQQAPVAVSIHPPSQPERARLVDALKEAADRVLVREARVMPVRAPLF